MRDLSFAQLIHVAVDGVDATHRISVAQQGRPLPFPVGHEEWHRETCAEAMLRLARRLGVVGPPPAETVRRFVDAAAAAERTAAVMAFWPHDRHADDYIAWAPTMIAGYVSRACREMLCLSYGIEGELVDLILDGHPQVAAVAIALDVAVDPARPGDVIHISESERLRERLRQDLSQGGSKVSAEHLSSVGGAA